MVAAASAVSVLVIDWTVIGASPPTGTLPTRIWRDLRRSMLRQGRIVVERHAAAFRSAVFARNLEERRAAQRSPGAIVGDGLVRARGRSVAALASATATKRGEVRVRRQVGQRVDLAVSASADRATFFDDLRARRRRGRRSGR